MTYSTINPEKSNGGLMTDYILYTDSSTFFQVANALPPQNPLDGLDDIPKMFRLRAVANRLAVAKYIQDIDSVYRLNEYIDGTFDGGVGNPARIQKQCAEILETLTRSNSAEALQSWYVEVYVNDDIVFYGRRPYPKHMDAQAIQTWLQREFNTDDIGVSNPQPHPFIPRSL